MRVVTVLIYLDCYILAWVDTGHTEKRDTESKWIRYSYLYILVSDEFFLGSMVRSVQASLSLPQLSPHQSSQRQAIHARTENSQEITFLRSHDLFPS